MKDPIPKRTLRVEMFDHILPANSFDSPVPGQGTAEGLRPYFEQVFPDGEWSFAAAPYASTPTTGIIDEATPGRTVFAGETTGGIYIVRHGRQGIITDVQFLLPLAGAEIIQWLDQELGDTREWGSRWYNIVRARVFWSPNAITLVFAFISAYEFDYALDAKDAARHSPTDIFQCGHGGGVDYPLYQYVTLRGRVVHGSKINNMLWARFGRQWGYSTLALRAGAYFNQATRGGLDGPASQGAVKLGGQLHDTNDDTGSLLTRNKTEVLVRETGFNESWLWPSPSQADPGRSSLMRPMLSTGLGGSHIRDYPGDHEPIEDP